jgi:hypothetical protein
VAATADIPTTVLVVAQDGTETEVARGTPGASSLALVDALMRAALAARRRGATVRVRGAPAGLAELLELIGLGGVVALEPVRQPEVGEQRGVEEVVQPADPAG